MRAGIIIKKKFLQYFRKHRKIIRTEQMQFKIRIDIFQINSRNIFKLDQQDLIINRMSGMMVWNTEESSVVLVYFFFFLEKQVESLHKTGKEGEN